MSKVQTLVKEFPNHYYDSNYNIGFMQLYLPVGLNEQLFRKTNSGRILDFKEYRPSGVSYYKSTFPKFLSNVLNLSKEDNLTFLYPPPSHTLKDQDGKRNSPTRLPDFLKEIIPKIICDDIIMPDLFERVRTIESKSHSKSMHDDSIEIRPRLLSKHANFIKNSKVIFFDDVLTTGSTMASCAEKLEQELNTKKLDLYFIALAGATTEQLTVPTCQHLKWRSIPHGNLE
ncbi:phosphoribosyltransferase [Leptospira perdikensis]|uniref:Phosphoribosyltransferase n=1 Tax=Leptospira perdikensis TaxID=2484948 RepID=A0A4R9J9V2_9LEPT|nr:phosphoribosyltransferase [Leptospira perdikensis]TGL35596.1 phosphoribosyltransferase [Leptospira perdikensis]